MSALGTSSQARKNAKKEANAARDTEGQASTFDKEKDRTLAKKRAHLQSSLAKIESTFDKEKDGPESTIAKKRAQLQTSLANIEIMVYNRALKQNEQNERERRYARLRVAAAEDLQVRTITSPADATSA
jgi:uncharacterized protein with gpF-like domain